MAAPKTPRLCTVMVVFTRSTIAAAAKEVTPHSNDPQPNMSRPGWPLPRKPRAVKRQMHTDASHVKTRFSSTIPTRDS